ncbi:isopropylmalate/homocitrate/citramalate synthase [Owenweeksia hongkongensis DSM 17368]|uniref:Isopropylmalate/homocitrate/citramalate synthase n=2 Tax=Owenweeksia TaxID=267986 RepID=G8R1G8_OWEHD|nr:isopropylmalate/homocitrate/citramalate synthase [Owenweeksia hongkongensis DSM 17368]
MNSDKTLKLVECPRDAMQGIHEFIPTSQKIDYINSILRVGFDTIDFGSFVSPKAIPQLKDTVDVLNGLELDKTTSKLLAIVANQRGAEEAVQFDEITYLGYPFSISEVFQKRNTNKSIAESEALVGELINICAKQNKELVVYISMGFGNPYDEPWNVEIVEKWSRRLAEMGVRILSLSDTIGTSNPESISYLFSNLIPALPEVEFGAHLHTTPESWHEKVKSAYDNGCRRFDGAIKGFGGCPMAADDLVGNMPMEKLLSFAQEKKVAGNVNMLAFESAYNKALQTFPM